MVAGKRDEKDEKDSEKPLPISSFVLFVPSCEPS